MSNHGVLLVDHIRNRSDFSVVEAIDGSYDHMGATLTDAVLQAGVNYKTVVQPRVDKLRAEHPEAKTTSDFAALLDSPGAEKLLNWKGKRKLETLRELTKLLLGHKVETEAEFRAWIVLDVNVARLRQIKGIKDKTSDYLGILLGISNVAVDRHLFRFLSEAGIPTGDDYNLAQNVVRDAAEIMGIQASLLDHSIWRHMSERAKKLRSPTGGVASATVACVERR